MNYIFPFEETFYIYKITNTINSKIYIGRTKNPEYRRRQHISKAMCEEDSHTLKIHLAMKELGYENFCLEVFEKYSSYNIACEKEIYWIKYFHSDEDEFGYNDKSGPEIGFSMWNDATRIEMSKKMSGKNNPMFGKPKSEKFLQQLSKQFSGTGNPFFGKNHSEETKKIIGQSSKGRVAGENNPHAKLNVDTVTQIRVEWKTGQYTKVALAKKYNVTSVTIGNIISGKTWK